VSTQNLSIDSKPKLLLVENDKTLLTMMSNALSAKGFGIVGTAINANTALEYFSRIMPDVVIIDVGLGNGPSGVDVVNTMRAKNPKVAVLFCTAFGDPRFANIPARLLSNCAYVPKDTVTKLDTFIQKIYEAIHLVSNPEADKKKKSIPTTLEFLNGSDIQLLKLISEGMSNKQIAEEKKITVKSCENAISRLAKKLEVPRDESTNQRVKLTKIYIEFSGKDT
jgi:DNA-binding NarL/FixJ family response regulator